MLEQTTVLPQSLIVLPEMFGVGFSLSIDVIAEKESCETEVFMAQLAQQYQSCVLGGVVTEATNGKGLNQAVAMGPDGEICRYTKLHPFTNGNEHHHYQRGESIKTFKWQDWTVAPAICYDLRFPEVFSMAAGQGAELLVVIANFPAKRELQWRALLIARAIENQSYVIGLNRTGDDPNVHYSGGSLIIDPLGHVVTERGSEPGVLSAQIDRVKLQEYRQIFPMLADRWLM